MISKQTDRMAQFFASVTEEASKPAWIWRRFGTFTRSCIKFTADESAAIGRAIERFDAVVTDAHAPAGTRMFTPPKVRSAISAQGLTEYVEDLQREIQNSDIAATTANGKSRQSSDEGLWAYALHNLIYLFRFAGPYEGAGNEAQDPLWRRGLAPPRAS